MVVHLHGISEETSLERGEFSGIRMSAEEFYELPDESARYELVYGVAVRSPSPVPSHRKVASEVYMQISLFLRQKQVGHVFYEMDVRPNPGSRNGTDLTYRPDILFARKDKPLSANERIAFVPDLVVEVVSRGTRRRDTVQKREDYERFGVNEYWIIDPQKQTMTFLRLVDGKYVEISVNGDTYESVAIPGFVLQLAPIREEFKPW